MTGCVKRRSTFTTTVLSCLSLTTTPCKTRFGILISSGPGLFSLLARELLALQRPDAGDVTADDLDPRRVFELPRRALGAQIELLLLERQELVLELIRRHLRQIGEALLRLHRGRPYSAMRCTKRVRTDSFAAPRRSASRATSSATPSISNMIRPGFTRAAQYSGAPLPLPIRTSVGFDDTGTSGKMRIQTRPWRFISRVIARRAASISRALTRSGSRHFSPNWPKFRSVPPLATPWMRPLNCLRNLVFLGCSMVSNLSRASAQLTPRVRDVRPSGLLPRSGACPAPSDRARGSRPGKSKP